MTTRQRRTSSESAAELQNYFMFADHLQEAIAKNRRDGEFAESNERQIIYFIDSNIVITYLLGEEERLKGILSLKRLLNEDAARVSQDLTVKYILSGGLPGQKDALLMSPAHWNEAMHRMTESARKTETWVAEAARAATDALRSHLPALKALAHDATALLRRAEELDIPDLLTKIRSALSTGERLSRTFRGAEPRIKSIDRHRLANHVINRTRTDDYLQWRKLLTDYRKNFQQPGEHYDRNIDADSKTLASIEALYRETNGAIGESAHTRYLMITSDAGIVHAAEKRAKMLAEEGIPNFVREPLVYNPLINFSSMYKQSTKLIPQDDREDSTVREVKKVFKQVEDAIDALFPSGDLPRARKERWLVHWELVENVTRWSEAAKKIALVNSKLLVEDAPQPEAAQIAEIFAADNIAAAAGSAITTRIEAITADHERNMSAIAFEHMADILRQPKSRITEQFRAPIKIYGVDLLQDLASNARARPRIATPAQLLNAIASGGANVTGLVDEVSKLLQRNWENAEGQLLASSIYLGVHAWESALGCARRAYDLARGRTDSWAIRREAGYCKALSLRMMLYSVEGVLDAKSILEENMAGSGRDRAVWARDAVERATLLISASAVQTISNERRRLDEAAAYYLVEGDLPLVFDDAVRQLDDAMTTLTEDLAGTDVDPTLISAIVLQGAANRLGAELLRYYLGAKLSRRPAELSSVLESAQYDWSSFDFQEPLPHPVAQSYLTAAKFELGKLSRDAALDQLGRILDKAVLTAGDKVELSYIRSTIRQQRTQRPDRAVA